MHSVDRFDVLLRNYCFFRKKPKIELKEDDSPVEEDENGVEILDPDDEEYVPSGRGRKRPAKRGFGNHIK